MDGPNKRCPCHEGHLQCPSYIELCINPPLNLGHFYIKNKLSGCKTTDMNNSNVNINDLWMIDTFPLRLAKNTELLYKQARYIWQHALSTPIHYTSLFSVPTGPLTWREKCSALQSRWSTFLRCCVRSPEEILNQRSKQQKKNNNACLLFETLVMEKSKKINSEIAAHV